MSNYQNTKTAFENFDKAWETAIKDPESLVAAEIDELENAIKIAYHKDTKDRNCLAQCMALDAVGCDEVWMRKLAKNGGLA